MQSFKGVGVKTRIILITLGGEGGSPELGKSCLCNICTLPWCFDLQSCVGGHTHQKTRLLTLQDDPAILL